MKLDQLDRCCLHDPAWTMAEVAAVLCAWELDQDDWSYSETHAYYVVQLTGGRYGLLSEDADTTGHGCICDSQATAYASLGELLRFGIPEHDHEARDAIALACQDV